jgi:hypothetical protein
MDGANVVGNSIAIERVRERAGGRYQCEYGEICLRCFRHE